MQSKWKYPFLFKIVPIFFAEAAAGVKGRLGDFPSNLKLLQVSREEIVNEWGDLIFSQMPTTLL